MNATLETVKSSVGTQITFERVGSGDPVILVGGAFNDRSTVAALATALAPRMMAVTYDRRGRGDSEDNSAGKTKGMRERELDDLEAVTRAVGSRASLFGHSSGGVLVLEAAASRPDLGVETLVVYEPAYVIEGARPVPGSDLIDRLHALLKDGRRDDAVVLYQLEAIGLPPQMVEWIRGSDMWPGLTALAPSLLYDAALYDPGFGPPSARLATISARTLAIAGSQTLGSLKAATRAVVDAIPHAEYRELEGEDHGILQRPTALAPVIVDFVSRSGTAEPARRTKTAR